MEAAPTPLQGSSATLHRAKAAASGMEAATVMPRVIVAQPPTVIVNPASAITLNTRNIRRTWRRQPDIERI
jgi:hypothetical protein